MRVSQAESHETGEAVAVRLSVLNGAVFTRTDGVNEAHARLLAESSVDLPPILLQRSTMRIIDGMHRVYAARLRACDEVPGILLDLDDDEAFLRAVAANVTHGLPLSLADRRASATRIITRYPEWSDRRVAKAAGLSGKTVGVLRRECGHAADPVARTGQDGRVRPTSTAVARQTAGELLTARPDASLREIAEATGLSPTTVRDVRHRLQQNRLPAAPPRGWRGQSQRRSAAHRVDVVDFGRILHGLTIDPSIRYTEVGRTVLRWLRQQPIFEGHEDIMMALPAHCLPLVAQISRQYAARWNDLAELAENRVQIEADS